MTTGRRTTVALCAGLLTAGCAMPGGGAGGDAPPDDPWTDAPQCDPAAVSRPPVATGTNIEGRPYPSKPATLTEDSVLLYLDDFETSFAWNRVLESAAGVTSLNVDNLDGFTPDETGDGFLAASGIRVSYGTEGGSSEAREYVANYFVSSEAVYRRESTAESATLDPEGEETVLVQCGSDA